jgi:hypothetical protein
MRSALAERGVALAESDEEPVGLTVGTLENRSEGSVRVRAELDAVPVDWSSADLGGAVTRAG